jgi:hypothetical protein
VIEETIDGPQAGHIQIDGRMRVFFVPGKVFSVHKDENKPVNFFLGFSPVGLRAWSVEHGHLGAGGRVKSVDRRAVEVDFAEGPKLSDEIKAERAKKLKLDRVMQFADDLIRSKTNIGAKLTLSELEERVDAAFGIENCIQAVGMPEWADVLSNDSDYVLKGSGPDCEVIYGALENSKSPAESQLEVKFGQIRSYESSSWGYIHDQHRQRYWFHKSSVVPADRRKLAVFQVVSFIGDENEKGLVALGVRILEGASLCEQGVISKEDLKKDVGDFARVETGKTADGVSVAVLLRRIDRRYLGFEPLQSRLSVKSVASFIARLEGLSFVGRPPRQRVVVGRQAEFGRLATIEKPALREAEREEVKVSKPSPKKSPVADLLSRKRSMREVQKQDPIEVAISIIKNSPSKPLRISAFGELLGKAFPGTGKLSYRLGFKSVEELARLIPGTRVSGRGDSRIVEAVVSELATLDDAKADVLRLIEIARRRGNVMSVSDLGDALSKVYPGEKTINKRLGFSTLGKMLSGISEVEISGEGASRQVLPRKKPQKESQ